MNKVPPVIVGASKSKEFPARPVLTVVIALIAFLLAGITITAYTVPVWWPYMADVGYRRAKRTIDPNQLLVWEQDEVAKHPLNNDNETWKDIPREEIPPQLRNLYWVWPSGPANAAVMRNDSTEPPYVKVMWGGGFYHYFFVIGRTNKISPDDFGYWTREIYYDRQ